VTLLTDDPILTMKDLQAVLKLSRTKTYALIQQRKIAHLRMGGSVRVRESAVRAYLASVEVAARPES
jgi:excisionase family DNA binding protein